MVQRHKVCYAHKYGLAASRYKRAPIAQEVLPLHAHLAADVHQRRMPLHGVRKAAGARGWNDIRYSARIGNKSVGVVRARSRYFSPIRNQKSIRRIVFVKKSPINAYERARLLRNFCNGCRDTARNRALDDLGSKLRTRKRDRGALYGHKSPLGCETQKQHGAAAPKFYPALARKRRLRPSYAWQRKSGDPCCNCGYKRTPSHVFGSVRGCMPVCGSVANSRRAAVPGIVAVLTLRNSTVAPSYVRRSSVNLADVFSDSM